MVNRTDFEPIIIDDFNHDPINQERVQSYPPELVGRFNSFIVTAFDDSMTVEMQLRTLIKWIKENIDVTMSALDNMEAFKQDSMAFQNHVKDTLVNLINQFTDTFDDNLQFEMQEILKQWDDEGYLQSLINEYTNERMDTLDYNKISKGQVTIADFTQEAKEYLANVTENGFPVVGSGVIIDSSVVNNTLSRYKTNFIKDTNNLFVRENAKIGYIWNVSVNNTVVLGENASIVASEIISLDKKQTKIYRNKPCGGYWLDASGIKTGGGMGITTAAGALDIPADAYYLAVNISAGNLTDFAINYGDMPTQYVTGQSTLASNIKIMPESLIGSIDFGKIKREMSTNIINHKTDVAGYYLDTEKGTLIAGNGNSTSDYITVYGQTNMAFSPIKALRITVVFYDSKGNVVGHSKLDTLNTVQSTPIPAGSVNARVSALTNELNGLIVQFGTEITTSDMTYFNYPKGMVLPKSEVAVNKSVVNANITDTKITVGMGNVRYEIEKYTIPYTNGDIYQNVNTYRITQCFVGDTNIVNTGAWEMAISIDGLPDFHGTLHGYEILDTIYMYSDSKPVTTEMITGDVFEIVVGGKLLKQGTQNEVIAKFTRRYVFSNGELKLTQKVEWVQDLPIKYAYLTMLPIRPEFSPKVIRDTDYSVQDLTSDNPVTRTFTPNVRHIKVFNDDFGVDIDVKFKDETIPSNNFINQQPEYNKVYYTYSQDTPVKIGDKWEVETIFRVN